MLHELANQQDIAGLMAAIGANARAASAPLAIASSEQKNAALEAMADSIIAHTDTILKANAVDMQERRGFRHGGFVPGPPAA